jgi:hypothetical protein
MPLYISAIEYFRENGINKYNFHPALERGRYWRTAPLAMGICEQIIRSGGITVTSPLGKSSLCADFRAEPRPQGGFVVSCEDPFR